MRYQKVDESLQYSYRALCDFNVDREQNIITVLKCYYCAILIFFLNRKIPIQFRS